MDMRDRVKKYGLKVVCQQCEAKGRHRPETQGRLRNRLCPKCGGRLRTLRWVHAHGQQEMLEPPPDFA